MDAPHKLREKIVIIGGGAAGTTCAFELRKLNKEVEITIIEKTENVEYSPCALPYVLAGEINSFDDIFIFQRSDYENNDIRLLLDTAVTAIDKQEKNISYTGAEGDGTLTYDKLVLATGSVPALPPIAGLKEADPFVLKTLADAERIKKNINSGDNSVVIGAGLVGLELAVALSKQKENVTVLEAHTYPLSAILDTDMGEYVMSYLDELGIDLVLNTDIKKVEEKKIQLKENSLSFDKLYVCTGMKPQTDVAEKAGLKCSDAIEVNDRMQTTDNNIYACGDCVLSTELNTGNKILSQLGTIALRQGKTVARNIVGEEEKAHAVVNNTITKMGDLFVGSVGLTVETARHEGFEAVTAKYSGEVRSEYYPPSRPITVKVVSDKNGKLLGGQIIGREEVAGRMNMLSLAIGQGMTLNDLIDTETCYNPASAPINEPVRIAAEICKKKLKTY